MSLLFRKLLKFWLLTKDLSDWLEEHISVGSLFQILLAWEKYEFVIFVFFLTESVVLTAYWFIGFLSDLVGLLGSEYLLGEIWCQSGILKCYFIYNTTTCVSRILIWNVRFSHSLTHPSRIEESMCGGRGLFLHSLAAYKSLQHCIYQCVYL